MARQYVVRGVGTTNAAAPKDFLSIVTQTKQSITVFGIELSNEAAVATQGVRFQWGILSSDVTGSAFTPQPLDNLSNFAAYATAKTVVSGQGGTLTVMDEAAMDILSARRIWYPPKRELVLGNGQIFGVRKITGADTSVWAVNVYFEE